MRSAPAAARVALPPAPRTRATRSPPAGRTRAHPRRTISVELPNSVVREITYTEPAVRGDTSGKVLKPAKLASGLEVNVPLFVATGDKIEIDTRTDEYKNRVK